MWRIMARMVTGEAEMSEIDLLLDVASQIEGHTICQLADLSTGPIHGLFRHFRPEAEARITQYRAEGQLPGAFRSPPSRDARSSMAGKPPFRG